MSSIVRKHVLYHVAGERIHIVWSEWLCLIGACMDPVVFNRQNLGRSPYTKYMHSVSWNPATKGANALSTWQTGTSQLLIQAATESANALGQILSLNQGNQQQI